MKHLSFLLFFFALISSAMAIHAKTYINGFDPNYPPFAFLDSKGVAAGFDIESINWVAKKMGFEIKHQPIDWSGIIPALRNKKIDMICSGMSISAERSHFVIFSEPYFNLHKYLAVTKDSNLTVSDIFRGNSKIGLERGTTEHDFLEARKAQEYLKIEVFPFDHVTTAITELLHNNLDAVAIDSTLIKDVLESDVPVKIIGTYADDEKYGVAIRKDDIELLKLINEGYKKLKADPYWKKLNEKYF